MAVTETGLSLYFASDRAGGLGGLDIYVSRRASINDPWGPPQSLGNTINTPSNDHCALVAADGHQLFFVSNREGGQGMGDLYMSFRRNPFDDTSWEAPQILTELNSASDDYGPTVFRNPRTGALTMFYNSNRPGRGGYDIYMSVQQSNGRFASPTLVAELSSAQDETFPMVTPSGLDVVFSSNRTGGLGANDLWVSSRATSSDPWSTPRNLGSPINTSSGEARGGTYAGGTRLAFFSNRAGGAGGQDLYESTRTRTNAVAVVGSVTGFGGTVFRPAGQISNPTATAISGNLVFHPAGREPSASDPMIAYTLNPFETRTFGDLMAAFGTTGIGWMEIVPTTGPAPAVFMRVENGGVVAVPAVGEGNILWSGTRGVLAVPSDLSRFRMNIGVRTFESGATMTMTVYDAAGSPVRTTTRSFPANQFIHLPASEITGGPIAANQTIVISIDSGSAVIYGSTVSNTGAGSSLLVVPRIEP